MIYKDFVSLYGGRKENPEHRFNNVFNAVKQMDEKEKTKMKASLDRELEVYSFLERGSNMLSIILTLMLALADWGMTDKVEIGLLILLIMAVIFVAWLLGGEKGKYIYLMSVIDNVH